MEFNQSSWIAGMNLLVDDTRLPVITGYQLGDNPYKIGYNQYRLGINVRNRFDVLQPILQSKVDPAAPAGIKQELVTFGNFVILFVAGLAYYRLYTDTGWKPITGFQMSSTAPRFWTVFVPVGTTNYVRIAATGTVNQTATSNSAGQIQLSTVAGASAGNISGLLVQDNVNQPQFIFLDKNGNIQVRTTQTFTQWSIQYTDATNVAVAIDSDGNSLDNREYVPVGNVMAWENGILYVTSQDGNYIYRSVSGRPLDFVVNVTNILAANITAQTWEYVTPTTGQIVEVEVPMFTQAGGGAFDAGNVFHAGGDATTTSYSVGVGGIVCLRPIASGGIFVAASNANFSVTLNQTPNAPTLFGEYTFIRTFLFNATCLSDRTILDSLGDTKFIDLTGIRSFNAVEQEENEGRNSQFSATIQSAFGQTADSTIIQDATHSAAILYDNYEFYAVNSIFGASIMIYDTILSCWTSVDIGQTSTFRIKQLAKIELTIQRLYAVGEDDRLYELYGGTENATSYVRLGAMADKAMKEMKVNTVRAVVTGVTEDMQVTATLFTNNRLDYSVVEKLGYSMPKNVWSGQNIGNDVGTQVNNVLFSFPNSSQGWKAFVVLSWTGGGALNTVNIMAQDLTPMQSLRTQSIIQNTK